MVVEVVFGIFEVAFDNLLEVLLELLSIGGGSPSLTTLNQGVDRILFLCQLAIFMLAKVGEHLHSLERDTWRYDFFSLRPTSCLNEFFNW